MKVRSLTLITVMGLSAIAGVKNFYSDVATYRAVSAQSAHERLQQYAPYLRVDPSFDAWTALMCSRESYEAPSFWSH